MIRKLVLLLGALAALTTSAAFAGTTIPPYINVHNGYIEVKNEIVQRGGAVGDFDVYLLFGGVRKQHARVKAGETIYFNSCCILAGTLYSVEIVARGRMQATVRPQLCNVRGIPFGYAVVVFTGHITYDSKKGFSSEYEPHVPTVSCPTS